MHLLIHSHSFTSIHHHPFIPHPSEYTHRGQDVRLLHHIAADVGQELGVVLADAARHVRRQTRGARSARTPATAAAAAGRALSGLHGADDPQLHQERRLGLLDGRLEQRVLCQEGRVRHSQ